MKPLFTFLLNVKRLTWRSQDIFAIVLTTIADEPLQHILQEFHMLNMSITIYSDDANVLG